MLYFDGEFVTAVGLVLCGVGVALNLAAAVMGSRPAQSQGQRDLSAFAGFVAGSVVAFAVGWVMIVVSFEWFWLAYLAGLLTSFGVATRIAASSQPPRSP